MPRLRAGLCPTLTEETLRKLGNAGIRNVIEFATGDPEEIARKSGVPFKDVLAIRSVLLTQHSALPVTGTDLYDEVLSMVAILPTGCDSLDELLDGGIYTTEVTEFVGGVACGKTQVCLNIVSSVVTCAKQNVVYVDTGSCFDVTRMSGMLESKGVSSELELEGLLSKIAIIQVFDIFELLTQLESIKHRLSQKLEQTNSFYDTVRLVVVDCLAAVVSPILGGQQREGQAYLGHVGRALKTLATQYSVAVLVTNNLVHGEGGTMKPALGKSWLHMPNTRVKFERNKELEDCGRIGSCARCRATLLKSGRQVVDRMAEFYITESGLQSVQCKR